MNSRDSQYMDLLVHTIGIDRIAFLERIDPDIIDANGRYMLFDKDGVLVSLSSLKNECEVEFLRMLHQNNDIASNVLINRDALFNELDGYYNPTPQKGQFEIAKRGPVEMTKVNLDRSQKYNSGFNIKDFIPANLLAVIVVIGIVVNLFAGSRIFFKGIKKDDNNSNSKDNNYAAYVDETLAIITEDELLHGESLEDYTQTREEMIKEVCDIYQLNYNCVYSVLSDLTDNFSSVEFLEGRLPDLSCKGMEIEAQSEYELYVYACRILKQDPGRWNVNTDNLYINNGYTSGTDYCALIQKVADVIGVDKHLLYSIVQAETSFRSDLFLNGNNPAGLKNSCGEFWRFDNLEEGLYEFAMEIKKYYYWLGIPTTDLSDDTIARIGEIHAPTSDNNQHWLPNVLSILEVTLERSEELFGLEVQNNGLSY